MKYAIYQIRITSAESDEINSMENSRANHPKFKAQTHAQFEEWNEVNSEFYEHVANIEANDLEQVFRISNCPWEREGLKSPIEPIAPMHSLSVGDIVVDENGTQWGVERYGFNKIHPFKVAV